jgi:hypothetical protein
MLTEIHRDNDGSIPALKFIAETPEDREALKAMLATPEPEPVVDYHDAGQQPPDGSSEQQ